MSGSFEDGERYERLGEVRYRLAVGIAVLLAALAFVAARVDNETWRWISFAASLATIAAMIVVDASLRRALKREGEVRRDLGALVDQVPVGIAVLDGPEHTQTHSNPAYQQMVTPESAAPLLDRVYRTGEPMRSADLEVEDGRVYATSFHPRRDDAGRVVGVLAIATEVTDRKHLEDQLRREIAAREEYLTTAAHELRTPLSGLLFQLGNLRHELEKQPIERRIQSAIRQADRVTDMISALLDSTRLEQDRLELEPEDFDLGEAVCEVVERFDAMAREAGCTISVELNGPIRGVWDRGRIEQVLVNLLGNAIKYGRGAPIVIAVRTENGRARISIADRGIGIPAEDTGKIFDRFERARSAKPYEGLGLGLYIARRLVEAHHGSIAVDSAPGEGATFTVDLPLAPAR